jgi:hypothetical protein
MAAGTIKKLTHKAFVASMAIWLSGVVFLVLCHGRTPNSMDSCPLVRMGAHCDKADKERDSEKVEKQSNETGVDCCAFIPIFFDKNRTSDSNRQVAASAPITTMITPRLVKVATNFSPTLTHSSAVLYKNNTFLKNRTFRI